MDGGVLAVELRSGRRHFSDAMASHVCVHPDPFACVMASAAAHLLHCLIVVSAILSAGVCNRMRRSHSPTHSLTHSTAAAVMSSSSSTASGGGGGGLSASPPAVLALDAFRMAGGVAGARQLGGGKDARVTAMACMGQSQEQ